MRKGTVVALLCLGMLSGGCGGMGDASTQPRSVVRDSAGVTIVENGRPAPDSRLGWQVSATPTVSIGVSEGDPNYELFGVTGATRLSDGRTVVANGGSNELKVGCTRRQPAHMNSKEVAILTVLLAPFLDLRLVC